MDQFLREALRAGLVEPFVAIVAVVILLALGSGFIGGWIGAYFGGRIGARRAVALMRREPALDAGPQLDDVRNSLDAIAVEVERISEGQRFAARLAADRLAQGAATGHRRDPGSVTPH